MVRGASRANKRASALSRNQFKPCGASFKRNRWGFFSAETIFLKILYRYNSYELCLLQKKGWDIQASQGKKMVTRIKRDKSINKWATNNTIDNKNFIRAEDGRMRWRNIATGV